MDLRADGQCTTRADAGTVLVRAPQAGDNAAHDLMAKHSVCQSMPGSSTLYVRERAGQ